MKKNILLLVVLLFVLGYSLLSIYKGHLKYIRSDRYHKLGSIEITLENSDNKIEPNGYKNGFDFNYDALPVISIKDNESSLFIELVDDNVNEITVGEDYYTNDICYKKTYSLNKTTQGKFELPIRGDDNNRWGKHATYYIKYNLDDEGVFVFKADFLFNTDLQNEIYTK